MDCNPKCEEPLQTPSTQSITLDMYTHTPKIFFIASRISRFRLQYHSIVIMNSNSRSSAPQHQHTTMDGNKNSSNSFASIEFKASFPCQTFTCITCGSLSPSSSNVPISKCHSNTSLVFQSSNHSLSLSLNFFSFCSCCHLLMNFEPHSTYIVKQLW